MDLLSFVFETLTSGRSHIHNDRRIKAGVDVNRKSRGLRESDIGIRACAFPETSLDR